MSGDEASAPTPTEVFEALGNETRLAIVEELAKPRRTEWRFEGVPFAELRKAVGIEDAGTFNYHLQKLQDHFVVKHGDEYVLQNAGFYLAGAIRAGTYTERVEPRRTRTDRRCPVCERAIEAVYESGFFRVECPAHGMFGASTIPPGAALGRSMDDLGALADRDTRRVLRKAREGVCPHCWGPMETTAPAPPSPRSGREDPAELLWARFSCTQCGMTVWSSVAFCVMDHPAVVSLYWKHGIDIRDRGMLEIGFVDGWNATLLGEDPTRVAVDVELDGDARRLTLDGTLSVVDVD